MYQTLIAVLVSGTMLAISAPAVGQTSTSASSPMTSWHTDVAPSVVFSPGLGEPARAVGFTAAVSVVRSETEGPFGRTRCIGVAATYGQTWSGDLAGGDRRSEQWVVAGPRFDNHPNVEELFGVIQPFVGIKRVLAPNGSRSSEHYPTFGVVFSMPAELGEIGGHAAALRLLDLSYMATPGDPLSRHRFMLSAGVDLGLKSNRR